MPPTLLGQAQGLGFRGLGFSFRASGFEVSGLIASTLNPKPWGGGGRSLGELGFRVWGLSKSTVFLLLGLKALEALECWAVLGCITALGLLGA